MFLQSLHIKGFRCIRQAHLTFNPGLNILIGENNAGKTAVIDALRICLSYGNQRRDIYVSERDFFIDRADPAAERQDVEFHLVFSMVDPEEAGLFHDMLSVDADGTTLQLHFRYYLWEGNSTRRVRYRVWGGDKEGQAVAPEVLDLLYFVYLGALRDAAQSLRPVRGNKLGELLANLEPDKEKRDDLAGRVHNVLGGDEDWQDLIGQGKQRINEHVNATSIEGKEPRLSVDFLPFEFERIVDNLRIQTEVFDPNALAGPDDQKYFDLRQNGLGYNNLIYTATVLGHLKRRRDVEPEAYMALLIEEPEAHLHPQLQSTFFQYLSTLDSMRFQTFISSHSPSITAKADLNALVVLQNVEQEVRSLAIRESELSSDNQTYLSKFLDVTKSQLLFASGVVLVEGISEALLLPIFSRMLGTDYDITRRGIELVNIGGVAFEHFARLFNSEDPARRLSCRCCILTDDDRGDTEQESPRAARALALTGGLLRVELAEHTFEYELFVTEGNRKVMLEVLAEISVKSAKSVAQKQSLEEMALHFVDRLRRLKAKSDFAHRLSVLLQECKKATDVFTVPLYIERGLKWVAKGE